MVSACHSGLSRILLTPLWKRGVRGDLWRIDLFKKSPSIPLCQRGKMKEEGFPTSPVRNNLSNGTSGNDNGKEFRERKGIFSVSTSLRSKHLRLCYHVLIFL